MTIGTHLFGSLVKAKTTHERLRACATLIMWFSAGAYSTSVVTGFFPAVPHEIHPDFLGGTVATMVGIVSKAV